MKTYNNLFKDVINFENMHNAYLKARKGKLYTKDVLYFSKNLEEQLISLIEVVNCKKYKTGRYKVFFVHEPKKRIVAALPFKDRVVQHALCNIIEPIWEKRFIYDSYACRKNKGTHAGANRTTKYLQIAQRNYKNVYVLKMDIYSYFPSINQDILFNIINNKIVCKKTLYLIDEIISSWNPNNNSIGIPIGNLTSQFFANIYLHELDKYIKNNLRIKYYIRYMDDMIIIHYDKHFLHNIKKEIQKFLQNKLNLQLNSKTNIFHASQGINFLGYRIWSTHRLIRKTSIKRIKRKLKIFSYKYDKGEIEFESINNSVQGWLGHIKHANTYNLRRKIFNNYII